MSENNCYHCGLEIDSRDKDQFHTVILGQQRDMCCPGCLAVANAIVQNGLEDYYQFRTEPAQKSDDGILSTLDKLKVYDEPSLQEEFVFDEGKHKQIQLTLEGITCAACGWLIEKQLSKVEGIKQVAVNVQERRALITWSPLDIKLSQILATLKRIGYVGSPFHPDEHEASFKRAQKTFLKKLGLAVISADKLVKFIYAKSESKDFIKENYPECIDENEIIFPELRKLAFTKPKALEKLEQFIYPQMEKAFNEKLELFPAQGVIIYDVPLLFEKELKEKLDLSVLVYASQETQIDRLVERDKIDISLANKIIQAQMNIEDKKKKADVVIGNEGPQKELIENIKQFVEAYLVKD